MNWTEEMPNGDSFVADSVFFKKQWAVGKQEAVGNGKNRPKENDAELAAMVQCLRGTASGMRNFDEKEFVRLLLNLDITAEGSGGGMDESEFLRFGPLRTKATPGPRKGKGGGKGTGKPKGFRFGVAGKEPSGSAKHDSISKEVEEDFDDMNEASEKFIEDSDAVPASSQEDSGADDGTEAEGDEEIAASAEDAGNEDWDENDFDGEPSDSGEEESPTDSEGEVGGGSGKMKKEKHKDKAVKTVQPPSRQQVIEVLRTQTRAFWQLALVMHECRASGLHRPEWRMKEMLQFVEALHFVVAPKAAQQLSLQYQTVLRNWNSREEELNINAVRDFFNERELWQLGRRYELPLVYEMSLPLLQPQEPKDEVPGVAASSSRIPTCVHVLPAACIAEGALQISRSESAVRSPPEFPSGVRLHPATNNNSCASTRNLGVYDQRSSVFVRPTKKEDMQHFLFDELRQYAGTALWRRLISNGMDSIFYLHDRAGDAHGVAVPVSVLTSSSVNLVWKEEERKKIGWGGVSCGGAEARGGHRTDADKPDIAMQTNTSVKHRNDATSSASSKQAPHLPLHLPLHDKAATGTTSAFDWVAAHSDVKRLLAHPLLDENDEKARRTIEELQEMLTKVPGDMANLKASTTSHAASTRASISRRRTGLEIDARVLAAIDRRLVEWFLARFFTFSDQVLGLGDDGRGEDMDVDFMEGWPSISHSCAAATTGQKSSGAPFWGDANGTTLAEHFYARLLETTSAPQERTASEHPLSPVLRRLSHFCAHYCNLRPVVL
eukprot:g12421.t1